MYDAHRHFLFVLPALAALLAAGASRALDLLPRRAAAGAGALLAAALMLAAADLAALHPYESVAFNRVVAGGVARGAAEYEGDFWAGSVREGVRWLAESSGLGRDRPLRVAGTSAPFQVTHELLARGVLARFVPAPRPEADLVVTTTRWHQHRVPGRVLHVVERLGAPLLYVIAAQPAGDAGPRRLPVGEATVDLPLPPGWLVVPWLDTRDRRARFAAESWTGAALSLAVATAEGGPVPAGQALREAVLQEEVLGPPGPVLGLAGRAAGLERLAGASGEGWYALRPDAGAPGGAWLVGAVGCGPHAVFFSATGGLEDLSVLLAGLAGARPGPPSDRRP